MELRSGYIIVGAYADKVRKTLFAQQRQKLREGALDPKEVARAAGELNKLLFELLVGKLKLDKGDVVRIRVGYDVRDGRVEWDYATLEVEVFRRVPGEDVEKVLRELLKEGGEAAPREGGIEVSRVGENEFGETILEVRSRGERVGYVAATLVDDTVILKGAFPANGTILKRLVVKGVRDVEAWLRDNWESVLKESEKVGEEEAKKAEREIVG